MSTTVETLTAATAKQNLTDSSSRADVYTPWSEEIVIRFSRLVFPTSFLYFILWSTLIVQGGEFRHLADDDDSKTR